jgi:type II secretory pathway predicted ATPase ExeA/cell division septation protein DedD
VTLSYEHFFGLHDAPFSLAPNPRYLFESATHTQALQQITYALERREPLIVMTGDIGTGKTLLCRTVLERLDRSTFVSVINNPMLDRDDLLTQMLQDFGVNSLDRTIAPQTASRHDLVHALEDFLSSLIPLNAHAVVMIDEAQHVQPDVLEQIRLLSNIAEPGGTMLQIILAGQLDLESLLARPELRQFQQRVSRRIRLEPLSEAELKSYIAHRLAIGRAAGSRMPGADELARALGDWESAGLDVTFTPDAIRAIWRWSGGLPRVVNLLCDHALEAAFAQRLHTIDADLIGTAAIALDLRPELVTLISGGPAAQSHEPAPESHKSIRQPVESDLPVERDVPVALDVPLMRAPFEPALTPAAPPIRRWLVALIVVLSFVAVGLWLTRAPADPIDAPAASATVPAPVTAPMVTPPQTASAVHSSPALPAAEPPSQPAAAPLPTPTGGSFEIVVASFRTEDRAAAAAAAVSDAGLPVRRRVAGTWLQVLSGPFASREEADAAVARLGRAGLRGAQIVSLER